MSPRDPNGSSDSIRRLAERIASDLGLEVVEFLLRGAGKGRVLRLDIDRPGPAGVGIEDCRRMSESLGAALDEADLIDDRYRLEVSSPGIDRPIRTEDDFRRNTGRRLMIHTAQPPTEGRIIRGVLEGVEGADLVVRDERDEIVRIARTTVTRAQQDPGF